jgi:hypothetical protein
MPNDECQMTTAEDQKLAFRIRIQHLANSAFGLFGIRHSAFGIRHSAFGIQH